MFIKNIDKFVLMSLFVLGIVNVDSFGMDKIPNAANPNDSISASMQDVLIELDNPDDLASFLNKEADINTLVVFDCDEVLLANKGTIPLNDKINGIVSGLQDKGIKVLVLTAVSNLDGRINQLKRSGFHFENSWLGFDEYMITDGLGFKNGVVTAGLQSKGMMLKEFLKHINIQFVKVIFIDDFFSNIEDVQSIKSPELFSKFLGIHYTEREKRCYIDQEKELQYIDDCDLEEISS